MHSLPRLTQAIPAAALALLLATASAGAQLSSSFPGTAAAPAASPGVRVVSCDEHVRSAKRGICMNEMSQADFAALAPGVSWYYNWHYETKNQGASAGMVFVPMMWGNRPEALHALEHTLGSASPKPPFVLGINEPNLKGQAFINPKTTADLYRKTKEITDRFHILFVAPNMALGSANNDSITAEDPVENKSMTYNFMVPFIKATLFYLKQSNIEPPALSFHSYGGAGEIKWAVEMMHKTFNCPIYVTEYAQWKTDGPEASRRYLIDATDYLERTPYVGGYAWFKDRVKGNPNISLLAPESGKLTPAGDAYVNLPAHDPNVYYALPGKLQAGCYATADGADIRPTQDPGSEFQMASSNSGGTLEYHVQVTTPGTYSVGVRVAGSAGKIDFVSGGQVIASAQLPAGNDWHTVQAQVPLAAGLQKLQVKYSESGICLHWLEFARRQL